MAASQMFRPASLLPQSFSALSPLASNVVGFKVLHRGLLIAAGVSLPAPLSLNVPDILSEIWDSILRAVPKKKTSHMKKRHRQMAGKGLKDVTSINRCSGCGEPKRAHLLCPYCVNEIRQKWSEAARQANP